MVKPLVSIIMGSDSDLNVMQEAGKILKEFKVPFETTIVSAHRTPKRLFEFAEKAHKRGIQVIIAGAGGAAHLPGMVAAISPLPVIGVPVKSFNSLMVSAARGAAPSNFRWRGTFGFGMVGHSVSGVD